jgi:hypothetical protein
VTLRLTFAPVLWFALGACGAAPSPGSARTRQAPTAVVSNVTLPAGVLEEACMPTGPELCFNAVDDNCNGVIDEGCGEETGVLQFTIAWGDSPADVNLTLVTPDLVKVEKAQRAPASAGDCSRDRDCPSAVSCRGQNIENIHCDASEPPPGHYAVEVALAHLNGAEEPVKVHFGARLGGRTTGFDLALSSDDPKKTLSFDVR